MAPRLPTALPRGPIPQRITASPSATHIPTPTPLHSRSFSATPSLSATLIRRPRRPYAFTQLVQLSDGSTFTIRTASPIGVYKSTKDTRNHPLWNPSDKTLQNVEVDEAGKLAAFRERFGRGWDASHAPAAPADTPDGGASMAEEMRTFDGKGGQVSGKGGKDAEAVTAEAQKEQKMKEEASGGAAGHGNAMSDLIAGYAVGMKDLPAGPGPRKAGKKK
ncbi:hypothetical protein F4808DRAFT_378558 [Astrocystis sublimbata]|nr:hypothetical protein F4808DRAFT_378558 [Astrocystis sublimbata]